MPLRRWVKCWGEFDLERLIAIADLTCWSAPGTAPYHGENTPLWYVPEEAVPVVDERVPSIGILTEDVSIAQTIARFAELAAALGADLDAPEIVVATGAVRPRPWRIVEAGGCREAGPARTGRERHGRRALRRSPGRAPISSSSASWALTLWSPDSDPEEYWDLLSWEQANEYPADLILNDVRAHAFTPGQLMEIPTWRELPAVQAGQVALLVSRTDSTVTRATPRSWRSWPA